MNVNPNERKNPVTPEFYTACGMIDPKLFTLSHETDRTLFIYQGPEPVVLHRVMYGEKEVESLVGKTLYPNAAVAFLRASAGQKIGATPSEMRGTGNVMRNGKVVRDNRTPESDASDADYNAKWAVETDTRLKSLVASAASPATLDAFLRTRSYSDDELRGEMVAKVLANASSDT